MLKKVNLKKYLYIISYYYFIIVILFINNLKYKNHINYLIRKQIHNLQRKYLRTHIHKAQLYIIVYWFERKKCTQIRNYVYSVNTQVQKIIQLIRIPQFLFETKIIITDLPTSYNNGNSSNKYVAR